MQGTFRSSGGTRALTLGCTRGSDRRSDTRPRSAAETIDRRPYGPTSRSSWRASTEDVLAALGAAFVYLVERLARGEPPDSVAPDAMRLGRALIGQPLESFARITEPVGGIAWERSAAGRRDLARLVTQLGLAWLPGEPSLLASLAGLEAEEGRWDEALALANQAPLRQQAMERLA